ncbi:hypothetical protein BTZ20_5129 [Rhodococcus sp. MTM3W5.2]|nr:hypothetical protein BTZ20_5129 [Rhodococcus sp. MTM3W5.2]
MDHSIDGTDFADLCKVAEVCKIGVVAHTRCRSVTGVTERGRQLR